MWTPSAISLLVHALAAVLLLRPGGSIDLPKAPKSEYQQSIAGHEKQILWYRFKKDLPDVSPVPSSTKKLPLKAESKAKQSIVAAPKQAVNRKQMILSPAPEIPNPQPVELANLIAVKMPEVAPLKPKAFTAPPDIVKPAARAVEALAAPPELSARLKLAMPPIPSELPKVRKRFTQPPLQVKNVPPKIVEPLPDAPEIAASFDSTLPEAFHVPMNAPRKPFKAPPAAGSGGVKSVARAIRAEAPPEIGTGGNLIGNNKMLDFAVVGLNPTDKVAPPSASSPGQFSAGPVLRKEGAIAAGDGKGLTVPDIFVRGTRDAKPDLIARAYASATSPENIRGAMRHSEINSAAPSTAAPSNMGGAVQVSSVPDARFQGRDVFMMAIQMPNLTSYSGSWLLWYAERDARQKGLGAIAPPVAYRKVDPKYIATAVEERVQGRVQLACVIKRDGHVAGIEIIRGIDDRLNRSAGEALSKWEFSPATRGGEPVDVDVLVEIPFHLAPKTKGPY